MFNPLDGPAKQYSISLSDSVVQEVKEGTGALIERQIVTILPIDGKIWVYFGVDSSTVPSANDVKTKGFPHMKGAMKSYEAGKLQPIYIVSDSGTIDVRIAERS